MVARALTPLALAAALLAVALPSGAAASHADLLLAALVLTTALGIPFGDLRRLSEHRLAVAALSTAPFLVLAAVGWGLGRAFAPGAIRDGLLGCGLSSSEVAAVGLVALAGADATIALGALTGSLVLAAVAGPVAIGWLGGGAAHAGGTALLGRFALVVLAPLAVGVAVRTRWAGVGSRDPEREAITSLIVVALVYASLSGAHGAHDLGAALVASAAFLAVSIVLALLWHRRVGTAAGTPGSFSIAMRDFAVAAALATKAFGPAAGVVPGVYGVLMLVAGSAAVTAMRRR